MNTFKKKSLYAALAGVGALGAVGTAQAVNVNPDGLGQVLIYPYYTTRTNAGNAYNSLLSVVNSTATAKAVKVRFLEGKASKEVLDFNLFLSEYDVWTTAIIPVAATGGAGIVTADTSCTVPKVSGVVGFVNYLLGADGAGDSLDRTKEGYVEIIEMGEVRSGTAVYSTITHSKGTNNVPVCKSSLLEDTPTVQGQLTSPGGGLFGGITLINVGAGTDYAVDATALDAFWAPGTSPTVSYQNPGDILPNLNSGQTTSIVFNAGAVVTSAWPTGVDAVSATLMHNTLMNEIVLDTLTASGTDWVITMPTKAYYVTVDTADPPFQRNFTSSGACDDMAINIWDREERTGTTPVGFSPPVPGKNTSLCWEANVLTWNNSNLFGSSNQRNVDPNSAVTGYQNGWARLDFTKAQSGPVTQHAMVDNAGLTYAGLPVIGFAAQSFNNNTRTNAAGQLVNSSFGGNFNHKTTRAITGLAP